MWSRIFNSLEKRKGKLRGVLKSGALSCITAAFIALFFDLNLKLWMLTVSFAVAVDLLWCVVYQVPDNVWNVTWWEHYHWGLLLILTSKLHPALTASAAAGLHFLLSEVFQDPPFSYGLDNFCKTVVVGSVLSVLVLLAFFL